MRDTKIPQPVRPILDQVSTLVAFSAFNESGYDLGSLIDSSSKISGDLNRVADRSTTLVEDSVPLLDSQTQTDALRLWAQSLAGITGQVVTNDPQVRTLLDQGPDAARLTPIG